MTIHYLVHVDLASLFEIRIAGNFLLKAIHRSSLILNTWKRKPSKLSKWIYLKLDL